MAFDLTPYLPAHNSTEVPKVIPPGRHELDVEYHVQDAGGLISGSGQGPFIKQPGQTGEGPSSSLLGSITYLKNIHGGTTLRLTGSHINIRRLAFEGGNIGIKVEKRRGWFSGKHSSFDLSFNFINTAIEAGDSDGNADHLTWSGHVEALGCNTFYRLTDNQSLNHIFQNILMRRVDTVFDIVGGGVISAGHVTMIDAGTLFRFHDNTMVARSNDNYIVPSLKIDKQAFNKEGDPDTPDPEKLDKFKLVQGPRKPSPNIFFGPIQFPGFVNSINTPFKMVDVEGAYGLDFFGTRNFPKQSLYFTPDPKTGVGPQFNFTTARGLHTDPSIYVHPESKGKALFNYINCRTDNGTYITDRKTLVSL